MPSADFRQSFEQAVGRLKSAASFPSRSPRSIGFGAFRREADDLIRLHGKGSAKFLRAKSQIPDPYVSQLAYLILALSADLPDHAAELTGLLRDSGFDDRLAVLALTYAPAAVALSVADEAWIQRENDHKALESAAILFRFFGDAGRAAAMDAERAQIAAIRPKSSALEILDTSALRLRLAQPPDKRAGWLEQDLTIWRATRTLPIRYYRPIESVIYAQADKIVAEGMITPSYLKDRLGSPVPTDSEVWILVRVAELQPDPSFAPELVRIVEGRRDHWYHAMNALLKIGTRESLGPVERLIAPSTVLPKKKPTELSDIEELEYYSRKMLVAHVCGKLARHGDQFTLHSLEAWVTDPAYPDQEREFLEQARSALETRLYGSP